MAKTNQGVAAEAALAAILKEFQAALNKFPPFHSAHEAYAVLAEEVDELWDEVKGHRSLENYDRMIAEAVQVGAMAFHFIVDMSTEKEEKVKAIEETIQAFDRKEV